MALSVSHPQSKHNAGTSILLTEFSIKSTAQMTAVKREIVLCINLPNEERLPALKIRVLVSVETCNTLSYQVSLQKPLNCQLQWNILFQLF